MATLSAFLRPNVVEVENTSYVASSRFQDEDGEPVAWEIRCIPADEYAKIRSDCMRQIPIPGKKNQFTQKLDTYTFQARVCARCTAFPDLTSAELQDSWGCATPEELLGKMLIAGEFDDYMVKVFEINGFQSENDLVDEAKN
jgi:hypothetical protein